MRREEEELEVRVEWEESRESSSWELKCLICKGPRTTPCLLSKQNQAVEKDNRCYMKQTWDVDQAISTSSYSTEPARTE